MSGCPSQACSRRREVRIARSANGQILPSVLERPEAERCAQREARGQRLKGERPKRGPGAAKIVIKITSSPILTSSKSVRFGVPAVPAARNTLTVCTAAAPNDGRHIRCRRRWCWGWGRCWQRRRRRWWGSAASTSQGTPSCTQHLRTDVAVHVLAHRGGCACPGPCRARVGIASSIVVVYGGHPVLARLCAPGVLAGRRLHTQSRAAFARTQHMVTRALPRLAPRPRWSS